MSELHVNRVTNFAGDGDPDIRGAAKAFGRTSSTVRGLVAGFGVASVTWAPYASIAVVFSKPMPHTDYQVFASVPSVDASNATNYGRIVTDHYSQAKRDRTVNGFFLSGLNRLGDAYMEPLFVDFAAFV